MPDDELHDERGVSRRQLITRAAAGVAIAWVTPVLTTMRVPAGAAGTPSPVTCDEPCSATNPCGFDPLCQCGVSPIGDQCVTASTVDGGCECVQPICVTTFPCDAGGPSCPPGFACVAAACCGGFCAPSCGTDLNGFAARRVSGPRRPWSHI